MATTEDNVAPPEKYPVPEDRVLGGEKGNFGYVESAESAKQAAQAVKEAVTEKVAEKKAEKKS